MTPDQIKSLIKNKGASLRDIAEVAEVSASTVSRVISGDTKSRRLANAIALFLGKRLDDLWPSVYPDAYSRRSSAQVRQELMAAVRGADAERAA